jgi:hypothetical protein
MGGVNCVVHTRFNLLIRLLMLMYASKYVREYSLMRSIDVFYYPPPGLGVHSPLSGATTY